MSEPGKHASRMPLSFRSTPTLSFEDTFADTSADTSEIMEPKTPKLDEGYAYLHITNSLGDGEELFFQCEASDPFNLAFLYDIELELNTLCDYYRNFLDATVLEKIQQGYETLIIGYLKLEKYDDAAKIFSNWYEFDNNLSSKTNLDKYIHPYNTVNFFKALAGTVSTEKKDLDIADKKLILPYEIDPNLFQQAFYVFYNSMKPGELATIVNQLHQFAKIFLAIIPADILKEEDEAFDRLIENYLSYQEVLPIEKLSLMSSTLKKSLLLEERDATLVNLRLFKLRILCASTEADVEFYSNDSSVCEVAQRLASDKELVLKLLNKNKKRLFDVLVMLSLTKKVNLDAVLTLLMENIYFLKQHLITKCRENNSAYITFAWGYFSHHFSLFLQCLQEMKSWTKEECVNFLQKGNLHWILSCCNKLSRHKSYHGLLINYIFPCLLKAFPKEPKVKYSFYKISFIANRDSSVRHNLINQMQNIFEPIAFKWMAKRSCGIPSAKADLSSEALQSYIDIEKASLALLNYVSNVYDNEAKVQRLMERLKDPILKSSSKLAKARFLMCRWMIENRKETEKQDQEIISACLNELEHLKTTSQEDLGTSPDQHEEIKSLLKRASAPIPTLCP